MPDEAQTAPQLPPAPLAREPSGRVLAFPAAPMATHGAREEILNALYAQWYDHLCGYVAHYAGDRDEAEDIVHGAYVALWDRHLSAVERPLASDYLPLLVHSVRHRLFDFRKVRKNRLKAFATLASHLKSLARGWMNSDEAAHEAALIRAMDDAIPRMSPRSREVYVMHTKGGMKVQEVAAALGVSRSTVRTLLDRANTVLVRHMRQQGFTRDLPAGDTE